MLAAHPVLCKVYIENSLELWPLVNWMDKTGLVYPFLTGVPLPILKERSNTRWMGLFPDQPYTSPGFPTGQGKKHQAVSHLLEMFMQQGWN